MNTKILVCDLEYAKKIKELGVVQESCFYWRKQHHVPFKDQEFKLFSDKGCDFPATYSAWTTTELGIMLPQSIDSFSFLQIQKAYDYWAVMYGLYGVQYDGEGLTNPDHLTDDDSLPNSMAKMLIHLIENKHITVEEINERFKGVRE